MATDKTENLPQLIMYKNLLHELPPLILPENITVRNYRDGEEDIWENIIFDSFKWKYEFKSFMKNDPEFKAERIFYAFFNGEPAATASAWYSDRYESETGYLHMVGVSEKYRGNRLGYLISLCALHKLKRDGYKRAVLQTDDFRFPAIHIYLSLGFEIDKNSHGSIPERWEIIEKKLAGYKK